MDVLIPVSLAILTVACTVAAIYFHKDEEPTEVKAVVKSVDYSPYIDGFISDQSDYYKVLARGEDGLTYTVIEHSPEFVAGDKVIISTYKSGHGFWRLDIPDPTYYEPEEELKQLSGLS